ncbi:DUF6493 family protein [Kitasatospora sp. NPDC054939]
MSGTEELLTAVREGRVGQVPALLAELDPAGRRACLAELKELRKQERAADWNRRNAGRTAALLVAGAGCHGGSAGAATWIGGRDFADSVLRHPVLFEVVDVQGEEWQADVATRLGAKRGSSWQWEYFELVDRIVRRTGCAVPASEGYLREWLNRTIWHHRQGKDHPYVPLVERLRADPLLPALLPRVFELADVGVLDGAHRGPEGTWSSALAELAASGHLDRAELIDLTTARLLRGGRAGDQRIFLSVLDALAPTPEEYAARARDLVALLDGVPVVAEHAQRWLGELDEAGLVEPELLAEASATVLFRSEKKLVRAQLGLLDRAVKRSPERAGALVLAAAEAFGHPDAQVQERALNLVARHLKRAGDAVLPQLLAAAEGLDPAHHARAGALFGAPVGGEEPDTDWAALLPPAPQPRPLGEPIATPEEVAEELSALLADLEPGVAAFERTLDGLVRHAHRDRAALAEALAPVLRIHQWRGVSDWHDCRPQDVLYVAAAVAGQVRVVRSWYLPNGRERTPLQGDRTGVYGRVLAARLEEAGWRVQEDRPPLLLATPTDATGALDARALVERLAAYEAARAVPGGADLGAALLRVTPTADPAVRDAAERLDSPAGRWLAQWLREGGLPHQTSQRVLFAPEPARRARENSWERWWESLRRIEVAQPGIGDGPRGPAGERLEPQFLELVASTEPSVARVRRLDNWYWLPTAHWSAALPHHREELVARWLGRFADAADRDQGGAPQLLPLIAESGGPAGLALHLALAYGLGARHADDRTAAVDGLLVLAAREQLDAALLGRELAELVALGTVKLNRLALALEAAAATGAYAAVWPVLAAALPGLLATEAPRGAGELVAVAADCARRLKARGPIAEVDAVAARAGSSRLVKEARALRDVLAG